MLCEGMEQDKKKISSKKWLSNPIVFDLVQKVDELMLKLRATDFQFAALRDFQFASGRAYRSITFFSLKGNRDFNMLMKDIQAGWLTDQLNCFFLEESILNKNLITEHMRLHQKGLQFIILKSDSVFVFHSLFRTIGLEKNRHSREH